MFGHFLPVELKPGSLRDKARMAAQTELRAVLSQMPAGARRLILHGLLRPNAILVGGYSTWGHRCCPLTSAVWEATGVEATHWDDIMAGISRLGLGQFHHRFINAFDTWALQAPNSATDPDGTRVLTYHGRGRLIDLIESLTPLQPGVDDTVATWRWEVVG